MSNDGPFRITFRTSQTCEEHLEHEQFMLAEALNNLIAKSATESKSLNDTCEENSNKLAALKKENSNLKRNLKRAKDSTPELRKVQAALKKEEVHHDLTIVELQTANKSNDTLRESRKQLADCVEQLGDTNGTMRADLADTRRRYFEMKHLWDQLFSTSIITAATIVKSE